MPTIMETTFAESIHVETSRFGPITADERALIRARHMPVIFGRELDDPTWVDRAVGALGPDVYITIDVDFFDPAIMPSTVPCRMSAFWGSMVQPLPADEWKTA